MRGLLLAAVALLAVSHMTAVQALTEGLIVHLDPDCSEMLTTIYSTYYPPPAGTACRKLMNDSLTETDPAQCPDANATIACFNQQQVQWMGFVAACEVFHWSDFNRGPIVPPGEGAPGAPAVVISAPAAGGNNAEGRRRLQSSVATTSSAMNTFYASVAYTTSGPDVKNGCFPTMRDPRHFYLYLEGRNLGASSAAGKRFAAEAILLMTAVAAASFAMLMA